MKENILLTIDDLVLNFMYYDRKEDEELSREDLEEAVKNGVITVEEMANRFKSELEKRFS